MPLPPGLGRAIADSTSPFGAYPPVEVQRNLEMYLADPRYTDAVYDGLISRACAEPLSVALVEKVVALLKAYLLKHAPSQDVLQLLAEFSCRVLELSGLSPAGRKAVMYVRSCLRQLGGERLSGGRHVRGSSNSLATVSTGRSVEELPRIPANGLTADGRVTAMKVCVGGSTLGGRANERYAAADSLPSPTDADLAPGPGQMLAWLRSSDGSRDALGYQDLRLPQGAGQAEPTWAVPSRPLQLPPAPLDVTAAHARSWLQHLPDLAPRVTLAAPAPEAAGALAAPPPPSLSGAPPISLGTIHRSVLDLDEQDIDRHISEVLGEARAEAQQLQPPAASRARLRGRAGAYGVGARDGAGGRRARPPRLLFHHPPYNRTEALIAAEADVAVVVEAVCGVRAAYALAAVEGPLPPGREAAGAADAAGGAQAEGMWQAAFEEDGEFGQICGGLLMKLLVDMWMRLEPPKFFVMVLRMLCRALRSSLPSTRARAFDVVYNLHLHGAMLRTDAEVAALAAAAAMCGNGNGGLPMPWQVCASAPVSPFVSGGGGGGGGGQTPPLAPRAAQPMTPAASTADAQTASQPGLPAAAPASHSLSLQGSALLDSGGELAGAPTVSRAGSRAGGGEGAGKRKDTLEVPRLPPVAASPIASPGWQQTAALGGGGGGIEAEGAKAAMYDRWLRALLFELLFELQQTREVFEEVWRAAMGCLAQMCSHGGYWVADRVQPLPPPALSCLLRAAYEFNWSRELYAQLLKLVPCVLLRPGDAAAAAAPPPQHQHQQPPPTSPSSGSRSLDSAFAAPAALKSAAAAAADGVAAGAAHASRGTEEVRRRLADFGGIDELLFHFVRAPTPDARASLLTALVQCCFVEAPAAAAASAPASASVSMTDSAEHLHVHRGALSPGNTGTPGSHRALDSSGGGGSVVIGGGGSGGAGTAGVLAVFQSLHLDSVCLALRAAVERPWQGMSSRLVDVLASAHLELAAAAAAATAAAVTTPLQPASPSGSVSGSAEYPLSVMHTLPAGVLSPISVRALLRPLLESLESCCKDSMTLPQAGELRQHLDVSVAHVAGAAAADATSPPPVTAASVAVAWRRFMEVCNTAGWQPRMWAVQWLHKLLSAACRACQGQIPLLSPLTLKTSPELSRMAAATAPPAGPSCPRPLWNTALADALLHVVREAPLGCELLMAAITRTAADLKEAAAPGGADAAGAPPSPRMSTPPTPLTPPHGAAGAAGAAAARVGGEEAALVACRRVMWLYSVGLQWMLQCGSAEARMPTVVELADAVLAALLQPDPTAAALQQQQRQQQAMYGTAGGPLTTSTASAADKAQLPISGAGARGVSRGAAGGVQPPPPQQQPPLQNLGQTHGQHAAAALQEPGGGMLISQQLLAGLLALDTDALSCTPPELLVTLLQQCSQRLHERGERGGNAAVLANGEEPQGRDGDAAAAAAAAAALAGGEAGFRSVHRGFLGRPCAVEGAATGAAAAPPPWLAGGGLGGGEVVLPCAAVGPWQDDWQDRRLALLLLLIARCSLDPESFARYSLSHVIKAQLSCDDLRCRYYAGVYLLKHWMLNQHDKYWRTLRHIIGTAQQLNDERLLDNPYLQMRAMLNVDHV